MMGKPDIDEGDPRQDHGNHQKRRGDQFGGPGARGGRFVSFFLAMGRRDDGVAMNSRFTMVWAMVGRGVFGARNGTLARKPGARADQRDNSGKNRAQQRQKDDGLVHTAFSPS